MMVYQLADGNSPFRHIERVQSTQFYHAIRRPVSTTSSPPIALILMLKLMLMLIMSKIKSSAINFVVVVVIVVVVAASLLTFYIRYPVWEIERPRTDSTTAHFVLEMTVRNTIQNVE